MDENRLMLDCRDVYGLLVKISENKNDIGTEEAIQEMFKIVDARCHIDHTSSGTLIVDCADEYDFRNYLYANDMANSFKQLVEDLSMMYYRKNGGKLCRNSADFITAIKEVA